VRIEANLKADVQIYCKETHGNGKPTMNPISIIYWSRALLGVVAALVCTLFIGLLGDISIFNGISIALLIYIISYYVYKSIFITKVEKASKLFSIGVGAYFLTWIVTFTLFFTLLGPTLTITSPAANRVLEAGETITIAATITNQFGNPFTGANVTANSPNTTLIQLTEISPGTYSAVYNVTASDPTGQWLIVVGGVTGARYRQDTVTVEIQASS
jgi:hypothetical protein